MGSSSRGQDKSRLALRAILRVLGQKPVFEQILHRKIGDKIQTFHCILRLYLWNRSLGTLRILYGGECDHDCLSIEGQKISVKEAMLG